MMNPPRDKFAAFIERGRGAFLQAFGRFRRLRRLRGDALISDQTRAAAAHREQGGDAFARRKDVEFIVGPFGISLKVGEQESLLESLSRELDFQAVPNRTVRAV